MPSWTRALLAFVLVAGPLAAAEPPFETELSLGFGHEGSATQRPLVVLDGTPTAAYTYSAEGTAYTVDVAATRWLSPVGDDGRTPFALLPWVARASSVTASYGLTGANTDSLGTYAGPASSLEVRSSGDRTLREASLSGEWFPAWCLAVQGALSYARDRSTDASTSLERPSGRADVSTSGTRSSVTTGLLGVSLRLGEHEVGISGSFGETSLTRDDASAFTGSSQPFLSSLDSSAIARKAVLATRLVFLDRRLTVDATGSYALTTSSSDLTTTVSSPLSQGRAIEREARLEVTWFKTRRLGFSAGFAYGSRSVAAGSPGSLRPSRSQIERVFSARVRWFASARVSVEVAASRAESNAITPPASTTFQRFEDRVDQVTLGAAVRF